MSRRAVLIGSCLLAVGTGCGGDGSTAEAPSKTTAEPSDREPSNTSPEASARRLAELVASTKRQEDCGPVERINKRSTYDFSCPVPPDTRRSMSEFEVLDVGRYGTAAIVEYRTRKAPDGASLLMTLTPEGEWGVNHFGLLYRSVGTSDDDTRKGFDETVAGYLRAIRERDCAAFYEHALTTSKSQAEACKQEFPSTKPVTEGLKATASAKPEYLGGTDRFGFYGLELAKPKPAYRTIVIVKTDRGARQPYLVMGSIPGPAPDGSAPAPETSAAGGSGAILQ